MYKSDLDTVLSLQACLAGTDPDGGDGLASFLPVVSKHLQGHLQTLFFFFFFVLRRSLHLHIFHSDEDCYLNYVLLIIYLDLKCCSWDTSSAPVAKTSHSQCRGPGLIPGKGTGSHILQLDMAQPEKQILKEISVARYFSPGSWGRILCFLALRYLSCPPLLLPPKLCKPWNPKRRPACFLTPEP